MKIEVDHRVSILQSLPEFRRAPPPILNSQYSGLGGGFRIKVMDIWKFGNLAATSYKEGPHITSRSHQLCFGLGQSLVKLFSNLKVKLNNAETYVAPTDVDLPLK